MGFDPYGVSRSWYLAKWPEQGLSSPRSPVGNLGLRLAPQSLVLVALV